MDPESLQNLSDLLSREIGDNTVLDLVTAAAVFVVVYAALALLQRVLLHRLERWSQKTTIAYDDVIVGFLKEVHRLFYVLIALFIALRGVTLPPAVSTAVDAVLMVGLVWQAVKLVEDLVEKIMEKKFLSEGSVESMPSVFRLVIRSVLWVLGGLLILSNLGIDITSLVAGLGIGGLAVSLALQNILGDLFSSFSIALDKPFEVGDFIIVGEHMGTVQHIGLKSTRLETLHGEELVMSNNELTSARVRNYKKMRTRRAVFTVGVTYDTPQSTLERIPGMIRQIIEGVELAEADHVHFREFGDSSLVFEGIYYVQAPDYNSYMDVQQAINFGIVDAFEKEGIAMAFPTRTVYLKKEES